MDWNDFAQRLARELMSLPEDAFLIAYAPGGQPFVQARRTGGTLTAEAVSNQYLPDRLRLGPDAEQHLAGLGWTAPDGPHRPHWWRDLTVGGPQAAGECARVAAMMTSALRDVYGLPTPDTLDYVANRNGPDGGPHPLDNLAPPSETAPYGRFGSGPRPLEGAVYEAPPAETAVPYDRPLVPGPRAPEPSEVAETVTDLFGEPPDELAGRLAELTADQGAYFELLLAAELVIPGPEPVTLAIDDGTFVLAFTSPAAMLRFMGEQAPARHHTSTISRLAAAWPDPAWSLALNPGMPGQRYLSHERIMHLEDVRQEARTTGPPHGPEPIVVQKVLPHDHVQHYLESGYDRVGGYVHRLSDVQHLRTPERLVNGLGLVGGLHVGDEAVHVLRWSVAPSLLSYGGEAGGVTEYRTASRRLPHGARLYRVNSDGALHPVAAYDADRCRWTAA